MPNCDGLVHAATPAIPPQIGVEAGSCAVAAGIVSITLIDEYVRVRFPLVTPFRRAPFASSVQNDRLGSAKMLKKWGIAKPLQMVSSCVLTCRVSSSK